MDKWTSGQSVDSSDVNNVESFNAEPILLVIDAEPRLSFSKENELEPSRYSNKTSPSRVETLGK